MWSLNRVVLIGHAGGDPDVRPTRAGDGKVATFRLATHYGKETEWHSVVAFGPLAETVERYVRKGRYVYVEGRLQTREHNGRRATEVVAQTVGFLDPTAAPDADMDLPPAEEFEG